MTKTEVMIPADLVDLEDGAVFHIARVISAANNGKRYWSLYDEGNDVVTNSGHGESQQDFIVKYIRDTGRLIRLLKSYKGPMRASEWAMTITNFRYPIKGQRA